jgi:hypothetical protein
MVYVESWSRSSIVNYNGKFSTVSSQPPGVDWLSKSRDKYTYSAVGRVVCVPRIAMQHVSPVRVAHPLMVTESVVVESTSTSYYQFTVCLIWTSVFETEISSFVKKFARSALISLYFSEFM